jgi:MoxR-like ATPase
MQRFSTSPLVILRRSSAMGEGPLIGREPELLALEQALGASRVVTLTGVGGSGKTRLARELAARLAERPGAPEVVVVELSTVRAAEHVVDAMLRAAGSRARPRGGASPPLRAASRSDRDRQLRTRGRGG